jgi:carbon monoxide dehydrogenase subunit G
LKIAGTASLPATPAEVWALLTDPSRLSRLLPGCERLDPDGPDCYKAAVKFGIAAISGKYAGTLKFANKKQPHSLILKMDGRGLPGFVTGEARIDLTAKGSDTELAYAGEAQVGGMIASVGQRMLEAGARKIVQQFFDAAKAELAATKLAGTKSGAAETSSPHKALKPEALKKAK